IQNRRAEGFDLIYKKVDSVFRGQIRSELATVARLFARSSVILLPQNPSRDRTISPDEEYRIDGLPLRETAFADDPDHPARSSLATDLLGDPSAKCITLDDALRRDRINIAAASSADDV